jgi:hypothetical protein
MPGAISTLRLTLRDAAAILLLLAQGAFIAAMPFHGERFFCWAPHDVRVEYEVSAVHNGAAVSPRAVQDRYGLPPSDWHALENVFAVIRTAESRVEPGERWQVTVRYRVNLAPVAIWEWP